MSIMSAEEAIKALTKIRMAEARGSAGNAIDALAAIDQTEQRAEARAAADARATADVPWDEPPGTEDNYQMVAGPDNDALVGERARRERQEELDALAGGHYSDPKRSTPEALKAFQAGITKAAAEDAAGESLTWAGGDAPNPAAAPMHARGLNPEFVGEDVSAATFPAGSLRGNLALNDPHWTTEYDASATKSVRGTSIAEPAGDTDSPHGRPLLRGADGTPLTGTFGYVVDPTNGTLYTFDPAEAYVTKNGQRLDITALPGKATILQEALAAGEHISFVHHSTALAGEDVAGAGQLTVSQGQITKIDDNSGHYRAEAEYLWQTVTWLAAQGMAVDAIDVKLIAKGDQPQQILKGWQFAQTGGNEAQIRAKAKATEELGRPEAERRRKEAAEASQRAEAARAEAQRQRRSAVSQETIAALKASHAPCTNLIVMQTGASLYCGKCDGDLDASYAVLIGTGSL